MRVSEKQLNGLLEELKSLSGIQNIEFDHNTVYGGYRFVAVNESGAHSNVLGYSCCEDRIKASEMKIRLIGLINGIKFAKGLI